MGQYPEHLREVIAVDTGEDIYDDYSDMEELRPKFIVNRKERRSPLFKTRLSATAKVLGIKDMKAAEEVLIFAMECKATYGTQLMETVETIRDLKAGAGDDYELSWLICEVRKNTAAKQAAFLGLLEAGIAPGVAKAVAGNVLDLEAEFGITSSAALEYIIRAVKDGKSMTADDMKEIALQLDEDRKEL